MLESVASSLSGRSLKGVWMEGSGRESTSGRLLVLVVVLWTGLLVVVLVLSMLLIQMGRDMGVVEWVVVSGIWVVEWVVSGSSWVVVCWWMSWGSWSVGWSLIIQMGGYVWVDKWVIVGSWVIMCWGMSGGNWGVGWGLIIQMSRDVWVHERIVIGSSVVLCWRMSWEWRVSWGNWSMGWGVVVCVTVFRQVWVVKGIVVFNVLVVEWVVSGSRVLMVLWY